MAKGDEKESYYVKGLNLLVKKFHKSLSDKRTHQGKNECFEWKMEQWAKDHITEEVTRRDFCALVLEEYKKSGQS